ncbi:MAG: ABC transporter ATP-binding protein [Chloroflexi bacterium]|nr:ABC transporter ATP-binding protein [Chloroflexota bacterium]
MNESAVPVIAVENVSKWFGSVVAVNDVSLSITPGITGLLGPNGAGKTTLLKMMEGLAAPSDGTVTIFGETPRNNPNLFRRVGVMSEHEAVYGFQSGKQFVDFSAKLHGVTATAEATAQAIERVGLADAQHRPLGTYSRGMRQRMRLAAAIVHEPQAIILDEPLNGTDPRQRIEFHDLMRHLADEGRTILISSHILEEVETLADRILLMVSGKLAASGDYRAIRAKLDEQPYAVRIVSNDPRAMAAALIELESIESVSLGGDNEVIVLSTNVAVLQRSLAHIAKDRGIRLERVEPLDDSLESVFSYIVEG